ncbi:chloride channel protein [uncultured Duncaniella sp.]|uniref:chloride channel protein n=1 Tax=uncultured Duncaniella sp. TaxID=2768039 RepID=UPI00272B9322|nr:chloride channel protein [uncultured Duncaniella sp.]
MLTGHSLLIKILDWREKHLSEKTFVFLLATAVGLLSGCGAFVLKRLISWVSHILTSHFRIGSGNYVLLLIPAAGIVLTGIFCRYVVKADLSDGTSRLIHDLKNKMYALKSYIVYSPILASTITLGFGGSAGSEGPIAYTGAAVGSNVARLFRLSPQMMMIMLGCGAGAGIAGIFKSPLGGALFTLEVLRMPMSTFSVLVLLVTSITAAMTAYLLSGCTVDIPFSHHAGFDIDTLPYVILLGIFCGFYSLYYSYMIKKVAKLLRCVGNSWIKNLIGGVMISAFVFLFPPLYGEGYGTVGKIINDNFSTILNDSIFFGHSGGMWLLIFVAGGIALAKCVATSATNNGGGVSGNFAPSLFAGCIVGFFFAALLNEAFGLHLPVGEFAFYAMAGVMAGAIRAPLMAIFLTCEMGAAYSYFFPLVVTASVSFGIVRLFTADSFFSRHADRHNGLISIIKRHKMESAGGIQQQKGSD